MIRYECDRCGARLAADDTRRYVVQIEVFAAADHLDLTREFSRAPSREDWDALLTALTQADPDEVEDQTYRRLRFDLCEACRRAYLAHPLGS